MTPHENALILIQEFGYNAREVGEVLGINTKTASDKMKNTEYNKFTEEQFLKLLFHFQNKIEKQSKVLKDLHQ